ncbi:YbdK family carboxylate-amine ligase [Microbacterium sp. CIAB417]|uniref:carboxylate-amine ligase n=1 Tax=Microbacterium sp. CIAB417 TaxID=2860287 RepID=UPI001FADCD83|nr:YbdK family carboxylate-amine ligase [Microbacterium sp. CIAB417]
MTRFGVEEEYFFLDPDSLAPVPAAARAKRALGDAEIAGAFTSEFLTCQLEYATSPAQTLMQAREQITAARAAIAEFAREDGCALGPVGTPFGTGDAHISPTTRYRDIARWLADIAGGHHVCGLHVHVEIDDPEDRVRALNRLRPWLPVLLALAGNSPFWHSRITGYRSWRTVLMRRLPTMGCPPLFRDHAHYRHHLEELIRVRAAPDAASLAWAARLSERFPTVEVRVFDSQLDPDDALLLAALTRAILTTEQDAGTTLDTDLIDATLWMAAREGLNAALIDPSTGEVSNARMLLQELMRLIEPQLERTGDTAFVRERIAHIRSAGTGAERQLAALRAGGVSGLARLLGARAVRVA